MSYKGIRDLYNDLNLAVSKVDGLNQFYMLDESEVNKLRNINYPVCISSIPNSSVSNINRAYEEYSMTLLILKKSSRLSSDYTELSLYDDCMDLFSSLSDEIMGQRNGALIIQEDSFEIERVSKLGNDLATGIRVNFTLLAPSLLAFESIVADDWTLNTNLFALFNGSLGVNRSNDSLSWTSQLPSGSPKTITHYNENNIPEYSPPRFTFSLPQTTPNEGFRIENVTFSTANWSIFFKMSVASVTQTDTQVLLRITDPSSGDGFIFGLGTHSGSTDSQQAQDGRPFYQIDDDNDSGNEIDVNSASAIYETSADLEPLSETVVGIVNDSTNNKLHLYVGVGNAQTSYEESGSHSNQFSQAKILIGTSELVDPLGYRGFLGTISHIAIYDAALSEAQASTVSNDLNSLF
jgi:hypothetical protein